MAAKISDERASRALNSVAFQIAAVWTVVREQSTDHASFYRP